MKKFAITTIVCLVLTSLLPFVSHAQNTSPPWFIVFEEHVSPANYEQFMKVQKEAVDLWDKHQMPIDIYAYNNDDDAIYWVVPIRNFASIDTLFSNMMQTMQTMKEEEGYDGNEKFKDLSTMSQTVMMWVPELSYHPNDEFGDNEGKPYREWSFAHLRSGHEEEAAAAIKDIISFFEDNNIDMSWDVFRVLLGDDTPTMITMFSAKDRAEMATRGKTLWENHGSEINQLLENYNRHARKIENKAGWYMADFSHFQQE